MAIVIQKPTVIQAAGEPPKSIEEFIGRVNWGTAAVNEESAAFHRKNGFRECGRFEQAGRKNGEEFDIVWI